MTKRKDFPFLLFLSIFLVEKEDKKSRIWFIVYLRKEFWQVPRILWFLIYVSTIDEKYNAHEWMVLDGAKLRKSEVCLVTLYHRVAVECAKTSYPQNHSRFNNIIVSCCSVLLSSYVLFNYCCFYYPYFMDFIFSNS